MSGFSAGSCIRFGWETFKKRPWFFIGVAILFMFVVGVVNYVLTAVGMIDVPLAVIMFVVRFLLEMLAVMGLLAFSIKAHDDVHGASLADFWHPQDYWKFLGSIIMQVLLVIAGFVVFVIPGIVVSVAVKFSPYFVIDKHEGPIESLFSSARITKDKKWAVFQFLVLTAVVIIAGFMALFVGFFVALPVVLVASVNAYRTLSKTA